MALGSAINIRPIERELKWLNTQFGGIAGTPVTNTLQWRFQSLLNHLPIWYGRNAEQHLVPSFVTNPVVGQKLIAHGIPTGAITKVPDEEGHRLQYFLWNMTAGGTVDNRLLVRGHYGLSDEQVIADTDWHPVLSYGYHLRSGCGYMKIYAEGKVSEGGSGQIRVKDQTTEWTETEYTTKEVWSGVFQPSEAVLIEPSFFGVFPRWSITRLRHWPSSTDFSSELIP